MGARPWQLNCTGPEGIVRRAVVLSCASVLSTAPPMPRLHCASTTHFCVFPGCFGLCSCVQRVSGICTSLQAYITASAPTLYNPRLTQGRRQKGSCEEGVTIAASCPCTWRERQRLAEQLNKTRPGVSRSHRSVREGGPSSPWVVGH